MGKVEVNPFARISCLAVRPTGRATIAEWAERNIIVDKTSPMPGPWRLRNSPWVEAVLIAAADNRVNQIAVKCSAQSSKTQTSMIIAAWAIAEDPGPMMWCMAARDEAITFARTRFMPVLENCKPVRDLMPKERHAKTTLEINFATMPLILTGANSKSKIQSKPIRWLLLDEVRAYPPGALEMVMKRTTLFWNSRQIMISTPDKKGDAMDRAFEEGNQMEWHFDCPACGKAQPFDFELGMKWRTDGETRPGGVWNFNKLAPTIFYECQFCKHPITDTPTERRWIASSKHGRMVAKNPSATDGKISCTWSAFIVPQVKWKMLVEEFLIANECAKRGDINPLKSFINERLGQSWEDKTGDGETSKIEDRKGAFKVGEPWSEEVTRILTADRQPDCFYFVCRAWAANGESRLIDCGQVWTAEDLREKELELKVATGNVGVDSGFNAAEIYRACARWGWKAFKGTPVPHFTTTLPNGQKLKRIYAKSKADPMIGQAGGMKRIRLFLFSDPAIMDMLDLFVSGKAMAWQIPRDVSDAYLHQLKSKVRGEKTDGRGEVTHPWRNLHPDDHLLDCEKMNLLSAVIMGLLRNKKTSANVNPSVDTSPEE